MAGEKLIGIELLEELHRLEGDFRAATESLVAIAKRKNSVDLIQQLQTLAMRSSFGSSSAKSDQLEGLKIAHRGETFDDALKRYNIIDGVAAESRKWGGIVSRIPGNIAKAFKSTTKVVASAQAGGVSIDSIADLLQDLGTLAEPFHERITDTNVTAAQKSLLVESARQYTTLRNNIGKEIADLLADEIRPTLSAALTQKKHTYAKLASETGPDHIKNDNLFNAGMAFHTRLESDLAKISPCFTKLLVHGLLVQMIPHDHDTLEYKGCMLGMSGDFEEFAKTGSGGGHVRSQSGGLRLSETVSRSRHSYVDLFSQGLANIPSDKLFSSLKRAARAIRAGVLEFEAANAFEYERDARKDGIRTHFIAGHRWCLSPYDDFRPTFRKACVGDQFSVSDMIFRSEHDIEIKFALAELKIAKKVCEVELLRHPENRDSAAHMITEIDKVGRELRKRFDLNQTIVKASLSSDLTANHLRGMRDNLETTPAIAPRFSD